MTDKQKASQALQYMEDEMDARTILQVLNPYLTDENLADVYDSLVKDGVICEDGYCMTDDDDFGSSDLKEAVAYVREQLGEDRLAVIRAQANVCYDQRRPIDTDYNDEVHDLLEEWGDEHDLCEEWWSESIELEDIIVKL